MAKVKSNKVTIKATKIDNNGKVEVKNKTFSKNNKNFKKDVDETKELIQEADAYNYVQTSVYDEKQLEKDKKDYKEIISEAEKVENDIWLDAKYEFSLCWKGIKEFGKGLISLLKGIWYSIKYLFVKYKK